MWGGLVTENGDVYAFNKETYHTLAQESAAKLNPEFIKAIPIIFSPDGSLTITDAIEDSPLSEKQAGTILGKYAAKIEKIIGMPISEIAQWNSAIVGDTANEAFKRAIK